MTSPMVKSSQYIPLETLLCVVEATGQEIVDALEMTARSTPGENGGFLQVSGLKVHHRPEHHLLCQGGRQEYVRLCRGPAPGKERPGPEPGGEYEPIDLEKTYTLASHNYMLKSGGDGINMFMDNKILQDEAMIDNQVLITYIRDHLKESWARPIPTPTARAASPSRICLTPMCLRTGSSMYPFSTWTGRDTWTVSAAVCLPLPASEGAMVTTVLYRMAGTPEVTSTASFSDIVPDSYYENAVAWAASEGIVEGYGDQTFRPLKDITRQGNGHHVLPVRQVCRRGRDQGRRSRQLY